MDKHIGISIERYLELRGYVIDRGYASDIDWSESIRPVDNEIDFWLEFAFVVLNSGMRNTVARGIWERVRPAVMGGGSAADVFGHKGKAAAIDYVWKNRDRLFEEYCGATDRIAYLRMLPWIGEITCWHLAKNFGYDVAKPDRHLVRIAGEEGVASLCRRLHQESGDRIATVDVVLWRAATLGLI